MKLFKPTLNSDFLIIFIHGFTGGKQTWLEADDSPKPLLSFLLNDIYLKDKFHYAVFEYSTSMRSNKSRISRLISKYMFGKSGRYSLPIKDVAINLRTQIDDRFENYKHIIIIGHSMGGLIGKQLINDQLDYESGNKIDLFITLATPHLGEGLASVANVLFNNPQIVDLQLFSNAIHNLTDSWIKKKNLPKRIYFTAQYDDVVKIGAAGLESEFVKTKHTFSSHSSIINPTNEQEDVVISLKKVLHDYYRVFDKSLPVEKTKVFFSRGTPHNLNQQNYIEYLKRKLEKYNIDLVTSWSPSDPIKQIKNLLNQFNGCLILALERTYLKDGVEKRGSPNEQIITNQILPTLWLQLEAAMAYQMGLPLLILKEESVKEEGMLDPNNHNVRIVKIDPKKHTELDNEFSEKCIQEWVIQIREFENRR